MFGATKMRLLKGTIVVFNMAQFRPPAPFVLVISKAGNTVICIAVEIPPPLSLKIGQPTRSTKNRNPTGTLLKVYLLDFSTQVV